jgi:endonuclease/exonuclease/phosphatase family metal-dependent hydrolase
MRGSFLICSLAGAVLAGAAFGTDDAVAPSQRFVIATYNINWGNVDLNETVQTIRASEADLVCLQETNRESERYLRRYLRDEYRHKRFFPGRFAAGFGFLSKVPLRHVERFKPQAGMFSAYSTEVRLGGRAVQVISVHLTPIRAQKGNGLRDTLRVFAQTEEVHVHEIKSIYDRVSSEMPTVILGDFNSPPHFFAPQYLMRKGFVDSLGSVADASAELTTWQWPLDGVELKFRIDYVFHTKDMRTISSRIIPTQASDHNLVVSTLGWIQTVALSQPATSSAPGR